MAVATYATDLIDITLCDSGSFFEFSGYTAGTLQTVPERDYFIQDSTGTGGCVSSTCKTTLNSIGFDYGSGITVPTDGAVFFWQVCWVPNSMNTFAGGGQRCFIGTTSSAFHGWKSGGNDYAPNPYGGWKNVAIDPTITPDYSGSGVTTYNVFGVGLNLPTTFPGKGAMFGMDAIRYGRGELRVAVGDGTTPATFTEMAAANDVLAARWGLFRSAQGGFLWKGLLTLGYGSAVYFVDQNKVILVDDCPRVGAAFTKIDIQDSGSTVLMTNCLFQALGTTTRGSWVTTDDATVTLDACTFIDMNTFSFLPGTTVLGSTFRRTNAITAGGATMTESRVEASSVAADSSALIWNVATDPNGYLDEMYFSKGALSHHAIELGTTSPLDITLTDVTFSGFTNTIGSSAAPLHIKRTGGTVTISLSGCSGITEDGYKSDGATVEISQSVPLSIKVIDDATGLDLQYARVYLVDEATRAIVIMSAETNSSGLATGSYTGSTPLNVTGWVRQWDLSGDDYTPKDISGEITGNGLSMTVRLSPI